MYQVCVYNNGIETTIQYPTADNEAPHLEKLPLKEGLSKVESLSFSIFMNNPGYNNLFELTTKVKVIDIRDNSIRFTGRVLNIDEKMDNIGKFYKEVLCEGALSYLNDSKTRDDTFLGAPLGFIEFLLNKHNSKVEESKRIQVGTVDITGSVAYTCNFEATLIAILNVKEKLGGNIRVREVNGILYLDWLKNFSSGIIDVTLGVNMKDMVKGKDITSLATRIIPLGANNLTIKSINSGLDYIEDINARNIYGLVEKTVEYRDITDALELKNTMIKDLSKHTQPLLLLESNALDLSFKTGVKSEQFNIGANLHIVNPVMNVDDIYKIVELQCDLLAAYDPKLTIANFPIKLTTTINDLRKETVGNNGVYNGVQVGDSFGLRIVRSDKKVVTTLNATEGISIENDTKKVFSVDANGNIVANDGTYNNIAANNMTAEGGTFNDIKANRGTFEDIVANRGTYNNITAKELRTSNTTNYMILHDQYIEFYHQGKLRMKVGFEENGSNAPTIKLYGESGISGGQPLGSIVTTGGGISLSGYWNFEEGLYLYSENTNIATRAWVQNNFMPIGNP